jgi:hypothetical protein
MFREYFESELSAEIKKSEKSDKETDTTRKKLDDLKVQKDKEANDKEVQDYEQKAPN